MLSLTQQLSKLSVSSSKQQVCGWLSGQQSGDPHSSLWSAGVEHHSLLPLCAADPEDLRGLQGSSAIQGSSTRGQGAGGRNRKRRHERAVWSNCRCDSQQKPGHSSRRRKASRWHQPGSRVSCWLLQSLQALFSRRTPLRIQAARIGGVEVPNQKYVEFSLQYIFGIGHTTAKAILVSTGVENKRTKVRVAAVLLGLVCLNLRDGLGGVLGLNDVEMQLDQPHSRTAGGSWHVQAHWQLGGNSLAGWTEDALLQGEVLGARTHVSMMRCCQ
jgi:hypothetical protein